MTVGARALVCVRQKWEVSRAAMAVGVSALAKVTYPEPAKRGDSVVHAQLAEYFTETLHKRGCG